MSSKGQIVLPGPLRKAHHWKAGTTFTVEEVSNGILLRPATQHPPTRLEDVVGCTGYKGPAKTIAEMDAAVMAEAKRHIR